MSLLYRCNFEMQGYVDVDFAGDIDSRKSTTGFVFILGGTAISWLQICKRLSHCLLLKLSML